MRYFSNPKGVILFVLVLFASGCAVLGRPEIVRQTREAARAEIARIMEINRSIPAYKGIGELDFFSDKGNWGIRGAWIGAPEGMLRVEPLGVAGQPLAKLICDREACYFLFFENGCYKKRKSSEKSLKPLTGIEMDVNDLVLLFAGGVPVYPHDFAWIDSTEKGRVLMLENRLQGVVEKIYLGPGLQANRVEVFGWRGLEYRADMSKIREVNGYSVPGAILIENKANAGLRIFIDRSWMGVTLPADVFVPKLPETNPCD